MNDNLLISYQLFSDIINLLDQLAEFLKVEIEHAPCPYLFNFIEDYKKLEQHYQTCASLTRELKHNECVALMERLFDETADQIQYIALDI